MSVAAPATSGRQGHEPRWRFPLTPDQRWPRDVVSDRLAYVRRFCVPSAVDDCMRECLAPIADTSLSGARVTRELATLFGACGRPGTVVSDNGTKLTSNAILTFADDLRIDWRRIAPGRPTRSAFIESFNGRLHNALLNETRTPPVIGSRLGARIETPNARTPAPVGRRLPSSPGPSTSTGVRCSPTRKAPRQTQLLDPPKLKPAGAQTLIKGGANVS
ncbi:DDE-type integrase/transposase/recombinase [Paracoccus sp. ME4]|uniref:DDE-type integrase/transposase/recombinase n=1 Tax=Paracoccus sp. ME4 TaxID=3138066 RepID=UPI00398B4890